MDNNLINIDDLVRQRLGGGQEPERSGAWSRMEQLLEKEDRRKPFGLYWKRTMMYCGVAMLLAAVSVGGYEMSSAFRNPGETTANPVGSAVGTQSGSSLAAGSSTGSHANSVSSPKSDGGAVDHSSTRHSYVSKAGSSARNHIAAGNVVASVTKHDMTAGTASSTVNDNPVHEHISSFASGSTSASIHTGKLNNNKPNTTANKLAGNNTSAQNNTTKPLDNQIVNHKNTTPAGNGIVTANVTDNNTVTSTTVDNANLPAMPKNDHVIDRGHGTAYVSQINKLPLSATANKPVLPVKPAVTAPVVAHNSAPTSAVHTPVVPKPILGKKVLERVVMQQRSTGMYAGKTETHLDTISIDRIVIETGKAKENNENTGTATSAVASSATGSKGTTATGNKAGNKKGTNEPVANNYAAQHNGAAGTTAGSAANKPANTAATATNDNSGNTQGVADNNELAANTQTGDVAANAEITPNAALPSTPTPPATENKPAIAKKKHGLNLAERLTNTFNEVKYKLGSAEFAPGLTAGINGTFFGPNSFKGFQFGLTGAFELDDNWSCMAELKYFHRMNNDYSMDVTYNKYRPTAGGYYKDSTLVSYGFSTLHSFELPITMRYTAAKFSFFLGGNFLYTLSVNTGGAEQLVDPNSLPIVSANTANTTPAIRESDFGGRFGVGYTCGIAYKVSPNVMLDFRNVQTVWDNAKASGSQSVSNQLYKSPSLQFSLFYRLGASKRAED